ncbi:MAG: flavodoxin domain-containing protein [Pseudomonadota bacterium]
MTEHNAALLKQLAESLSSPKPAGAPEFIPADAPFDEDQRVWLEGLFTGLFAITSAAKAGTQDAPGTPLKIFFGSQSGTSESLSKDLRKFAGTQGFDATIAELDSISPADLTSLNHVLIIAATFGEGEPTDNAQNFYKALMADDAPALPATLHYSVCGMGDRSYAHFNQIGRDLDARLEALGATRAAPLVTCDVDYDDDFASWKTATFDSEAFKSAAGAAQASTEPEAPKPAFDKTHPFLGTLLDVRCLNGEGSAKAVNHIEISLAGGGVDLDYAVGDALGVWPINDAAEVKAILSASGFTGGETVTLKSGPSTLRAALLKMLDLTTVTAKTGEAWGVDIAPDVQVIDVLEAGIEGLTPQALVDGLRALQPRLYSISSSPKKHPGEVHLTVGEVRYDLHGRARQGCASTFLGQRCPHGNAVGVYVQKSSHFHLPADDTAPVIMIGPGTGVAPFRAFLEEREMRGAPGDNWLFFGDQHQATDYLYGEELAAWEASGVLNHLSLAWSRDGADKVYVQHLIEKEGERFFEWLERGASIYVCGDASRMAADVDEAIRAVVATHSGNDREAADAYVEDLKKAGRYQRDVY